MLGIILLAAVPYALMVERMENPVGIDAVKPRLSWKLPPEIVSQSAYEIDADDWQSGKVESSQTLDIPWGGGPLGDSQRVKWRVRAWNEVGEPTEWSEQSTFVAGITSDKGWRAKWIGPNPKTCPNVELGGEWLEGEHFVKSFERGDDYACELVIAVTRPFTVKLDDRIVFKNRGSFFDYRHLRFLDLAQYAHTGTNRLEIILFKATDCPGLRRVNDPEVAAICAMVRDSRGARFSSKLDWGGKVLTRDTAAKLEQAIDFREELESPSFERKFVVGRDLKRATLHVTGLGFYEAFINGKKIGKKVLEPSPTDYEKRLLYSTYILDDLIKAGENKLKIDLGHGWYDMRSVATWNFESAPWRDRPKAIAQLELEYADGRRELVVTDKSWMQVKNGTVFDCVREGEIQGAVESKVALPLPAVEATPPRGTLQCAMLPPSVVAKEFAPESIVEDGKGRWIVTFPVAVAGWARCVFRGLKRGDEVSIRYDENLSSKGGMCEPVKFPERWYDRGGERLIDMFYQSVGSGSRLRKGGADMQVDHFVSAGAAVEQFESRFVWHGFRYVILEGLRTPPRREDITALLVRTDFGETGSFECSNEQLTELVRMTLNSYRANFTAGFPTDCPHREKLGWTGDAWIASELGQLYFENTAAYEKWLTDVIDTQKEDGSVACIAPTSGWGYHWGNGPVFDAVLGMLTWNLWNFRGDRKAVAAAYPALKRYLAYEQSIETDKDLVGNGLDDWNAYESKHKPKGELVISCVYLRLREIAAKFAEILGNSEEAKEFAVAAARTRKALYDKYYRGNGIYDNGGQAAQALAVMCKLYPDSEKKMVAAQLVKSFECTGYHIDCGLVGAKIVYRALSEVGRGDVALKTILNPTAPSMTKWIGKNGTLWEDWRYGQSKCHIMLGDFSAWAMEYIAGIRRPEAAGYAKLTIEPTLVGTLSWARGDTETPLGRVASEWKIEGGKFILHVEIPSGCRATIKLPNGTSREVKAGKYDFTQPFGNVAKSDDELNNATEMNAEKGVSGERRVENGVKVLFVGNSITLHSSLPSIGWTNCWGMAASCPENDYVHLVTRGIECETGRRADIRIINVADFERGFATWKISPKIKECIDFKADYLVFAIGENTPRLGEAEQAQYREALKKFFELFIHGREKPHVVVRGVFWPSEWKDECLEYAASDLGFTFVKADFGNEIGMDDWGHYWHSGVARHPGDAGMVAIANAILDGFFPRDSGYAAWVNGKPTKVRPIRVSRQPFNQWAAGYQRPADQTETAGLLRFETDGAAELKIRQMSLRTKESPIYGVMRPTTNIMVRPISAGVKPRVEKDEIIAFTIPKPGYYVLEIDGWHRPLEIFAQPKRDFASERREANIVFGAGRHERVIVKLKSHDRVYLDKGAVVYGSFQADNVEDVKVSGYGIICGERNRRVGNECYREGMDGAIRIIDSKNITFDGPTVLDSCCWCVAAFNSSDVTLKNLKVTGAWRYNTDGIDICNSQRVTVDSCYIHSFDDALVVKGISHYHVASEDAVADVKFSNCVCWCGWGRTLEIGLETWAKRFDGIVFEDCDLIHNSGGAISIHLGGPALIENASYRNIRIECDGLDERTILQTNRNQRVTCPTGNQLWWLRVENEKMFGSGFYSASKDFSKEPYGNFKNLKIENVSIIRTNGAPIPRAAIRPVKETKFDEIDITNVTLDGAPLPTNL